MKTMIISVMSIALLSTAALAQTAAAPVPVVAVAPAIVASAEKVCAPGAFVLSSKASEACASKVWPKTLKDGSRFTNVGVGAEFNTLIRQLKS